MKKSVPAFVLGLIGGIIGIVSGLCDSICATAESSVEQILENGSAEAAASTGTLVLILAVGGAILGLVGACLCFKKAGTGAILELAAAAMVLISAFVGSASFVTYIVIALFAIGGLVGMKAKAVDNN